MSDVEADVRGADTLARTLAKLARDLDAPATVAPAAAPVVAAVRAAAPRRSGRLAGSVAAQPAETGVVRVAVGVRYAGPIVYGVGPRVGLRGPHNIAPNRFLLSAANTSAQAAADAYTAAVQRAAASVKGA